MLNEKGYLERIANALEAKASIEPEDKGMLNTKTYLERIAYAVEHTSGGASFPYCTALIDNSTGNEPVALEYFDLTTGMFTTHELDEGETMEVTLLYSESENEVVLPGISINNSDYVSNMVNMTLVDSQLVITDSGENSSVTLDGHVFAQK